MASVETISNVFTATIRNLTQLIETKVDKTTTINGQSLSSDVVILNASDIGGFNQIDNTRDMDKPVSYAQQAALNTRAPLTTTVNGHALSETNIIIVNTEIPGVEYVNNTPDLNKPVSTAQQAALNLKVDKTTTINGYALSSDVLLDKSDVGLSSVDNTSDVDKPISTAQQVALDTINTTLQSLNASLNTFSSLLASAVPVGCILMIMTDTVPVNYLICDGSVLLQSAYPELWGYLGTTYCDNSVNTSTHFQLPDLRGEFVRGLDNGRGVDANRTFGVSPQGHSTALPSLSFTSDSQGDHVHTTSSSGAHTHTTDTQGAHTHTVSTSGDHTHSMTFNTSVQSGSSTQCLSVPNYNGQVTQFTNTGGAHTHTLDSQGSHSHTTSSSGAHTHTLSVSGSHSHSITGGGDGETRPINHACHFIIKAKSV